MALKAVGSNPIIHPKKALASASAFFIQSEGLAWNHRAECGAWNPSLCDGMASRFSVHISPLDIFPFLRYNSKSKYNEDENKDA